MNLNMKDKNNIKQKHTEIIFLYTGIILFITILFMFSGYGFCSEKTFETIEKSVSKSIVVRQKTQHKLDRWDQKKTRLIAEYERLKQEEEFLEDQNKTLTKKRLKHENRLQTLVAQKQENLKIQKDMLPFLHNVVMKLSQLISEGLPFLRNEREKRMGKLEKIMDDPDVSIAEKYRKTMEALFIEAGYGNTMEVVRKKITISGSEVLEDIFRLGRVSLFALSLDHKSAAYFNMVDNKWRTLDKKYIKSVYSAMEMSRNRRTAELVSLPIGRLGK